LLVLDRSEPLTAADRALLACAGRALVVANKCDLPAAWETTEGMITVSAERGDGLDLLAAEVARRIVPRAIPPGAGVPFRPSHARQLDTAIQALDAGETNAAVSVLRGLLGQ
jgi:tRNA modification GTPase